MQYIFCGIMNINNPSEYMCNMPKLFDLHRQTFFKVTSTLSRDFIFRGIIRVSCTPTDESVITHSGSAIEFCTIPKSRMSRRLVFPCLLYDPRCSRRWSSGRRRSFFDGVVVAGKIATDDIKFAGDINWEFTKWLDLLVGKISWIMNIPWDTSQVA